MHRHGYQGRKFGRQRDQRQALITGLASALVMNGTLKTTLPKAKETARYTEKLVGLAKKGDLASRRQVIVRLSTLEAAHKLVDDIAPKLGGRNSGYFRVKRTTLRRGDGAQMAMVSFVDDLSAPAKSKVEKKPASKAVAKKTAVKAAAKAKRTAK
jgi:large subunit ribosomal protein L17